MYLVLPLHNFSYLYKKPSKIKVKPKIDYPLTESVLIILKFYLHFYFFVHLITEC